MSSKPTSRRAVLAAGAVAGVAGAVGSGLNPQPALADGPLVLDSSSSQVGLTIRAAGQGASFNQAEGAPSGTHTLTCNCNATSGANSALNVTSDNPDASTVQISGHELGKGTVKISHVGSADGSDGNAAAISIDLKTAGTKAQGIFIDATSGGTSGPLLQLRNGGTRQLRVWGDGRIQFDGPATTAAGSALPASPSGYLRMLDSAGRAIRVPFYNE